MATKVLLNYLTIDGRIYGFNHMGSLMISVRAYEILTARVAILDPLRLNLNCNNGCVGWLWNVRGIATSKVGQLTPFEGTIFRVLVTCQLYFIYIQYHWIDARTR